MLCLHRLLQYLIKILLVDTEQLTIRWNKKIPRLIRHKALQRMKIISLRLIFHFNFPHFSFPSGMDFDWKNCAITQKIPKQKPSSPLSQSIPNRLSFHLHNRNYPKHGTFSSPYRPQSRYDTLWESRWNQESHISPSVGFDMAATLHNLWIESFSVPDV